MDNSVKEMVLNYCKVSTTCPNFTDAPVGIADIDFIEPHWTFCKYEGICLDKGGCCPILPPGRKHPRLPIGVN